MDRNDTDRDFYYEMETNLTPELSVFGWLGRQSLDERLTPRQHAAADFLVGRKHRNVTAGLYELIYNAYIDGFEIGRANGYSECGCGDDDL